MENKIDREVLALDMEHLTPKQIKYLHDLKAIANKGWATRTLNQLKGESR